MDHSRTSEGGQEGRQRQVGAAVWLASGTIHAAALAAMAALVITHGQREDPPVVLPLAPPIPQPQDHRPAPRIPPRDPTRSPVQVDTAASDAATVTQVDLPPTPPGDDADLPQDASSTQGDPIASSDSALAASAGVFTLIGAATGDASKHGDTPFRNRNPRGPKPPGTPRVAVVAARHALDWFKRHQSPDGSWSAVGYWRNCSDEGPKCEPGKDQAGDTDVALTAYAVLCFLGDGYDASTPSPYRTVVQRGLAWLGARQDRDGLLGSRNYEHAIATMVLAQAYAMSPDPALRPVAQRAVDALLARENRDRDGAGLGWDYALPGGRNDASVTGWCVMAVKSAYSAGLRTGDGLAGCRRWLEGSWRAANTAQPWCAASDRLAIADQSRFPYVWTPASGTVEIAGWDAATRRPRSGDSHDLAAVGLLCAVFLGRPSSDPMLETLANYVVEQQLPAAWPCNTYYLYYGTLALYQVGGERWRRWDAAVAPLLAAAQHRDGGCLDGSWDWQGTRFHGHDTGRVLSTAYACLAMQAHWLYARQTHPVPAGG